MMRKFRNNKGVTLVALAIAVAIIMILTNVVVYNAIDGLRTNKLGNLQADIENLRDKVSNYYSKYGAIPADTSIEYTNISNLSSVIGATDTGKFYVIDLAAMENVTLNYGRDYEKIRNKDVTTKSEINNLTDLYIINFDSHNVFYVAGIEVDGKMYYTDYTEDHKDTVPVTIHGNQEYKDENGDIAIIPEGFEVSDKEDEQTIENGLVIKDESGNEFVWVPVENPIASSETEGTTTKAMAIQKENNYVGLIYTFYNATSSVISRCTEGEFGEPIVISGDSNNGITKDSFQEEYNGMIESVKKHNGFYVGRYELGLDVNNNPMSKKAGSEVTTADASNSNTKTWYGLYSKSKEYAKKDENKSVVSSMMWESQYNAILNWIQTSGIRVDLADSSKTNNSYITGTVESDLTNNIYDIYGCHYEWTLGAINSDKRKIYCGAAYNDFAPSLGLGEYKPTDNYNSFSTHMTLYIK